MKYFYKLLLETKLWLQTVIILLFLFLLIKGGAQATTDNDNGTAGGKKIHLRSI